MKDDYISRQAAIDALMAWEEDSVWDEECLKHRGEPYWVAPSDVIEQLPSAQPEQRWIPCSERLPEEDTYVLATTAWGEITMAKKLSNIAWFIYEGNANAKSDDIVAWMLLPEPYQAERSGE